QRGTRRNGRSPPGDQGWGDLKCLPFPIELTWHTEQHSYEKAAFPPLHSLPSSDQRTGRCVRRLLHHADAYLRKRQGEQGQSHAHEILEQRGHDPCSTHTEGKKRRGHEDAHRSEERRAIH